MQKNGYHCAKTPGCAYETKNKDRMTAHEQICTTEKVEVAKKREAGHMLHCKTPDCRYKTNLKDRMKAHEKICTAEKVAEKLRLSAEKLRRPAGEVQI